MTKNSTSNRGDNSMNALDWNGTYHGVLPCADCAGIEISVKLRNDLTYVVRSRYEGKSEEIYHTQGVFVWSEDGSTISLNTDEEPEEPTQYQVGENRLFMLDRDGKRITGDLEDRYILEKVKPELTGSYWKLVEVMGKEIPAEVRFRSEPHLLLEEGKLQASGGCNRLLGSYDLKNGQRISFSQLTSTRMACPDMTLEDQLVDILGKVDNYAIQGDNLSLSKGKMSPLVRFEAQYLN